MDHSTAVEREAQELGRAHGEAAGSWVTDGNSSDETRRAVIQMINDGDPAFDIPAPLSGEWADGYTLGRLSDELGVDEGSDEFSDLCTAFEDAYYEAYEATAYADAKGSLPEPEPIRRTCPECDRVFDLTERIDAAEWAYGHDCES